MKKVFDLGVFDTSKRRMVEGDIVKQIKDYHIHLSTFRQEIDFWFSLLEKTSKTGAFIIINNMCYYL